MSQFHRKTSGDDRSRGICLGCAKTYDQIAVGQLTHSVVWSENREQTIED